MYIVVSLQIICFLVTATYSQDEIVFKENTTPFEGSDCVATSGENGICTVVDECPKEQFKLISSDICVFRGSTPIVCCIKKPLRKSEKGCEKYYPTPRKGVYFFIGGIRSFPGQHPHIAAVGWNTDGRIDWKCGGSLIEKNFIITAAHCASNQGVYPNMVRIGDLNLLNDTDVEVVDYRIVEIFVHPLYDPNQNYHDIAIFRLEQISEDIGLPKPICLWPDLAIPQNKLLGMGYGTTAFAGPRSNELFEGELNLIDNNECRKSYSLIDGQMCAKDLSGERDTCQGDSGGPLQFQNGTRPYLVGVTSYGEFCLGAAPGVYTRIYSYLDWIESIVWQ